MPSSSLGGEGIILEYKVSSAADNTYQELTHGIRQDLVLETYTFRCTVTDVNPVNQNNADGGTFDTCPNGGLTSVSRDVVNIDFYFIDNVRIPGVSVNDEEALYNNGNSGLFNLIDTFTRTITVGDTSPDALFCRADVNINGVASPSTADTPYIEVPIYLISKYI